MVSWIRLLHRKELLTKRTKEYETQQLKTNTIEPKTQYGIWCIYNGLAKCKTHMQQFIDSERLRKLTVVYA